MSDGLVMPSTVVIPELLSIEMHVSFSFLLYIIVKATHTPPHLEVVCAIDYIIYRFHFGMVKGRHFKTFVIKEDRSLVGLRVFLWQLILTLVVSCLPPPCSLSSSQSRLPKIPDVTSASAALYSRFGVCTVSPPRDTIGQDYILGFFVSAPSPKSVHLVYIPEGFAAIFSLFFPPYGRN